MQVQTVRTSHNRLSHSLSKEVLAERGFPRNREPKLTSTALKPNQKGKQDKSKKERIAYLVGVGMRRDPFNLGTSSSKPISRAWRIGELLSRRRQVVFALAGGLCRAQAFLRLFR